MREERRCRVVNCCGVSKIRDLPASRTTDADWRGHTARVTVRRVIHTGSSNRHYFVTRYLDLHGAGVREGKVFITDLAADGLHRVREKGTPFDVIYVDGVQHMAYDGNWSGQKIDESEYDRRFEADDARYAEMLQALVASLRARVTTPR